MPAGAIIQKITVTILNTKNKNYFKDTMPDDYTPLLPRVGEYITTHLLGDDKQEMADYEVKKITHKYQLVSATKMDHDVTIEVK